MIDRWAAASVRKREAIELRASASEGHLDPACQRGCGKALCCISRTSSRTSTRCLSCSSARKLIISFWVHSTLSTLVEPEIAEQVEIDAKYSGYITRQQDEVDRLRRHEKTRIPAEGFDYHAVKGLSNEVKQKLYRSQLLTRLPRASRIPGVTPAAISLLIVQLKKHAA